MRSSERVRREGAGVGTTTNHRRPITDSLEHIKENFETLEVLKKDLPPVVSPPPAKSLLKLYPMFAMNSPGMVS